MEEEGARVTATGEMETPAASALPVYGHAPFKGIFRLKLEASGRVALPAALKGAFAGAGVLRPHREEHLDLYTPQGFRAVAQQFAASNPMGPKALKRFHMSSPDVVVDKQSRFVIPPELKARVGLGERIVLAGAMEAIEIWPAEGFEPEEATFDEVDLFFDGFEGLL